MSAAAPPLQKERIGLLLRRGFIIAAGPFFSTGVMEKQICLQEVILFPMITTLVGKHSLRLVKLTCLSVKVDLMYFT